MLALESNAESDARADAEAIERTRVDGVAAVVGGFVANGTPVERRAQERIQREALLEKPLVAHHHAAAKGVELGCALLSAGDGVAVVVEIGVGRSVFEREVLVAQKRSHIKAFHGFLGVGQVEAVLRGDGEARDIGVGAVDAPAREQAANLKAARLAQLVLEKERAGFHEGAQDVHLYHVVLGRGRAGGQQQAGRE